MAAKHPWFPGGNTAYLIVHRIFLGEGGKEKPGRVVSDKLQPHELMDESALRQRFGAGRFRVSGRNPSGQFSGPPVTFDIPDANGVVPLTEDGEHGGSSGGDRVTLRDLLNAANQRAADERQHYQALLAQARADRTADMQFFSQAMDGMGKNFTAAMSAKGEGSSNSAFNDFMFKRLEALEKRAEGAREKTDEWREKALRRGDDSVFAETVRGAMPHVMEMFTKSGSRESKEMLKELDAVRKLKARLERELEEAKRDVQELRRSVQGGAAPAAAAAPAEPKAVRPAPDSSESQEEREAREGLGLKVSAKQIGEYLEAGGEMSAEDLEQFAALHRAGKLTPALVNVLTHYDKLPKSPASNGAEA